MTKRKTITSPTGKKIKTQKGFVGNTEKKIEPPKQLSEEEKKLLKLELNKKEREVIKNIRDKKKVAELEKRIDEINLLLGQPADKEKPKTIERSTLKIKL